ncbi:CocE/NonD family hydrolase, partial [Candidatus Dependentiae bacterium]|nr:CocE/NonD family hydrolase [Candidatus Dependentiae bacterium]
IQCATEADALTRNVQRGLPIKYKSCSNGSESYVKQLLSSWQKIPIVLEMLPYRKDDSFYIRDYAYGSYLASNGIAFARVDIRGTGSSYGRLPSREYSDIELADIQDTIEQLSSLDWCNGNIGMQGISWSAFNALMTAMSPPKALKAIYIAHAADDLYAHDIHYIDGALHIDMFSVEMETENILPRTPDYLLDAQYFLDRFDREPWIFTYLTQQTDGPFWQQRSLQSSTAPITIPVYAIAGILDGYRDYAITLFDHVKAPLFVDIGPWNHAMPHESAIGPQYEDRNLAVQWWRRWLLNDITCIVQRPPLHLFVRDYMSPTTAASNIPGSFCDTSWPMNNRHDKRFFLTKDHALLEAPSANDTHSLIYKPDAGVILGDWWGETIGDMSQEDSNCLTYDSEPFEQDLYLIGSPRCTLRVSASASVAHWIVRLEDIAPDGAVSLVTGGLKNGTHRFSPINPEPIQVAEYFDLAIPLHFTTWKCKQGHRLRIAISNAQFPMIWPTPYAMTTTVAVGQESLLDVPLLDIIPGQVMTMPPVEEMEQPAHTGQTARKNVANFTCHRNVLTGITTCWRDESYSWHIHNNNYNSYQKITFTVNTRRPAYATFVGEGSYEVTTPQLVIKVQSCTTISSDKNNFNTLVEKRVMRNNKTVKKKIWKKIIPRQGQ